MMWTSPEKFVGVLARLGSAVVHRKGPFCSFENLLKRSVPLDSSRKTMRFRLVICPVWSLDDFWIEIGCFSSFTR